jgi:putative ABC transport system substrate-binding protein
MRLIGLAVILSLTLTPLVAEAQPSGKVPRVGVLASGDTPAVEAFKQGLRELGYVERQNVATEWRFYEGRADRALGLPIPQ